MPKAKNTNAATTLPASESFRQTWRHPTDAGGELEKIPGLRVNAHYVSGHVDSVAAAKRLCKVRVPEPACFEPVDVPPFEASTLLRDYQMQGILRLLGILSNCGGALLADDMGLGKTVQAITTLTMLDPDGRRIVVCPASVRETWRDDLKKWGETSVAVLGPRSSKAEAKEWDEACDKQWVVTSYEMLTKAVEVAFAHDYPSTLVMDEAHMLKGRKGVKRADKLTEIARLATYRLALTGTPVWDRPRDFWRQLDILLGGVFGRSWDFDHRYCGAFINEWGGLSNTGATNTEELKLRLSYYMVRREKREVAAQLPALSRQVMWIDSTIEARRAFQAAHMQTGKASMHDALVATLKGKMPVACELAKELKQFVMFTWIRAHAHQLAKMLNEEFDTPCIAITGDMDTQTRQREIKLAATRGWGVVATIDSVGTGVDALKHVASTAIVHAIDWVPTKMAQAESRLHRIGQQSNVHIIYLAMKESMDAPVVRTVTEKLDQWTKVMGSKSADEMFHSFADHEEGAGDEAAALKAIYDSMED